MANRQAAMVKYFFILMAAFNVAGMSHRKMACSINIKGYLNFASK
jgi:hypothetical protein